MARRGISVLFAGAVVGTLGCGPEPAPLVTSVQQFRTSDVDEAGAVHVGFDLFAADSQTAHSISCDVADLTVDVFVSPDGETYEPVDGNLVRVECAPATRGDVAIVVDNSGSEDGFLDDIRDASGALAEAVIDGGGLSSTVRISTRAHVVQPMTDDVGAALSAIEDLWISNGWTALYDGVRVGSETLESALDFQVDPESSDLCTGGARRSIALYTDGRDNNSAEEKGCETCMTPPDGIDTTLSDLTNLDVGGAQPPIYVVGVGSNVDHDDLSLLAAQTGGAYFGVESHAALLDVLPNIAGYSSDTARVCFDLPAPSCGEVWIRIDYSWVDGDELVERSHVQKTHFCPDPPRCDYADDDADVTLVGLEGLHVKGDVQVGSAGSALLRSNGEIRIQGSAHVDGSAASATVVALIGNGAELTGSMLSGVAPVRYVSARDAVTAASLTHDNASIGLTARGLEPLVDGVLTLRADDSLVLDAGSYYFTGIDIAGTARLETRGPVRIHLDGPAKLAGRSSTLSGSPADLQIISGSHELVHLTGTAGAQLLVYAPDAPVLVDGTGDVRGSIIAEYLTLKGDVEVDVDPTIADVCPTSP